MGSKNRSTTASLILALLTLVGCGDAHEHDAHGQQNSASAQQDHSDSHDSSMHEDEHEGHHDESTGDAHDEHEMRQSGTHLHGDAKLAIAVEDKTLYIELDSPIYNLTGFEYAPTTPEEKSIREKTELLLAKADNLFSINSEADCKPQTASQDVHLEFANESASETDHSEDDNDHHSDDHHESESATHGEDSHGDVAIEYRFNCQSPKAISEIEVHLFKVFSRIEELDTVYLDQTNQRSITLRPDNSTFTVNP